MAVLVDWDAVDSGDRLVISPFAYHCEVSRRGPGAKTSSNGYHGVRHAIKTRSHLLWPCSAACFLLLPWLDPSLPKLASVFSQAPQPHDACSNHRCAGA